MELQTISNIVLSALSLILVIISLVTVFISLRQNRELIKQNNEMIKNSTRPYLSIYIDNITIVEQQSYFVLKNFGSSSAKIDAFIYDSVLKSTAQIPNIIKEQFDSVPGIVLAPGQNKLFYYDMTKLEKDVIAFTIRYSSLSGESYEESIELNVKNYIHIPVSRPGSHTYNSSLQNFAERLVFSAREIIERSM